jgi:hypothetical protein
MSRYSRPRVIEYENWIGKIIRKTEKAIQFRAQYEDGGTIDHWVATSQLSTESQQIVHNASLYQEIEIDIPTWITTGWMEETDK